MLDHAAAAFANGSGTLNLDFGTLQAGSGTQARQFQIENLPAAYRAGLDLDSVLVLSNSSGVFSTDAMPFTDLAAGAMSNSFDVFLDTSQVGEFSGQYQLNLSDEKDLSGWAGQQTLTLDVTANVVPEPGTLALLGAGVVGLLGQCYRRRSVATANRFDAYSLPRGDKACFTTRLYGGSIVAASRMLVALILLGFAATHVDAQTFTTLLSFSGTNGMHPNGDLTLSGSTLFGMTDAGGTSGAGNIFSIGVDGTDYQNLLSFSGTGGQYPGLTARGSLTLSGSTLYGMTLYGGPNDDGNVFSVGVNGANYQNLFSFSGLNGEWPPGSLVLSGSTLFGMTGLGGMGGTGNLFSIGVNGTNYQNLRSLGGFPFGSLTLSGSTLYGMTSQGGNGYGNIFSIGINGTNYQNLFSFNDTDGALPEGSLTVSGSILYGMTYGNVFSIDVDGTNYQSLLSFNGTNGRAATGSLTLSGSTLYGMTSGYPYSNGNIFSIGVDGTNFQNLFSFSGTDGGRPYGSLTLSGSTLYGTTFQGGSDNDGTVFSLNLNPTPEPSTLVLLAAGALGVLGYAWRKRRRDADQIR